MSKEVKAGQKYELLRSHGEQLLDVLYVPKIFKTMKFVAYSQTVFKTFLNNYSAYVATAESYEDAALRDKLMSPEFIVNFLFVSDVCCRVAQCSQQVQISSLLPWQYPVYVESLKTDINMMIEIIDGLRH